MTEIEAEALLAAHLRINGGFVATQVRLGLKRADVLVDWATSEEWPVALEAIEVKLADWRRGAHQAYLSGMYANAASVAVPRKRTKSVNLSYLADLGVGLIVFDEVGWTRVLEPRMRGLPTLVSDAVRETMGAQG